MRNNTRKIRSRSERAFTLIELIISIVIISIASAIAAPRLGSSANVYRVEALASRVASEVSRARRLAAAAGTTIKVKVGVNGKINYLDIIGVPDGNGDTTTQRIVVSQAPYYAKPTTTTFAQNQVIFDLYGKPNTGGTFIVHVGPMSRTVAIDAVSGRAEVTQ